MQILGVDIVVCALNETVSGSFLCNLLPYKSLQTLQWRKWNGQDSVTARCAAECMHGTNRVVRERKLATIASIEIIVCFFFRMHSFSTLSLSLSCWILWVLSVVLLWIFSPCINCLFLLSALFLLIVVTIFYWLCQRNRFLPHSNFFLLNKSLSLHVFFLSRWFF